MTDKKFYGMGFRLTEPSPSQAPDAHPYDVKSGERLAKAIDPNWAVGDLIKRDGHSLRLTDTYRHPGAARRDQQGDEEVRSQAAKDFQDWKPQRSEIVSPAAAAVIERETGFPVPRDGKFREIPHPNADGGSFYASCVPHPTPRNRQWDDRIDQTKVTIDKGREIASQPFKKR